MNSKLAVTALGLAMLVATPAFAQKPTHRTHASGPYASATSPAMMAPVVAEGRVIGTDPDPSIRFELARDAATYSSTN